MKFRPLLPHRLGYLLPLPPLPPPAPPVLLDAPGVPPVAPPVAVDPVDPLPPPISLVPVLPGLIEPAGFGARFALLVMGFFMVRFAPDAELMGADAPLSVGDVMVELCAAATLPTLSAAAKRAKLIDLCAISISSDG